VIQHAPDFGFTEETFMQYIVALHFFVRNLDRHLLAIAGVGRAEYRRHSATGNSGFYTVVVQQVANEEVHVSGNGATVPQLN
jgi:hypothetical protein